MNNFKKSIIAVIGIVVLGGGIYLYMYFSNLNKYKSIVEGLKINTVDLAKVKNGTFEGSCDAILVGADVSVTVKDSKITDIKLLKHKTERGQKAEGIPEKVLQTQSLKVDTVSGATNSSKIILKAIEIALENGEK
jgi:uncharacterized protein with FMN-binding domain